MPGNVGGRYGANIEGQLAELAAGTSPEATISKLAEIWDPEIELDATEGPVLDLNSVYRGADAVRQFWQEWFSAWETLQFDYELVDAGERVVMLLDLQMRGRSTGIELPFGKFAWVSTFRGRVGRPREALHEAVGGPRSHRAVGIALAAVPRATKSEKPAAAEGHPPTTRIESGEVSPL